MFYSMGGDLGTESDNTTDVTDSEVGICTRWESI